MRRSIVLSLAIAAMAFCGTAVAEPMRDGAGEAPQPACDDPRAAPDRNNCPAEPGVIDHLPDSFFVGGGGVGPQVVEAGGGEHVWAYAAGGASASAGASARASASASVSVRARVSGRARGRW